MILLEHAVHEFTASINAILSRYFGEYSHDVFSESTLIQYLNQKTVSASRGSKSRSSFANLYALYVVVEDYVENGFLDGTNGITYREYDGAKFSDLLRRQREMAFGAKLQNHALNSRLNEEYRKFFPSSENLPIVRDLSTKRYWIQENLLKIPLRLPDGSTETFNIARPILDIVDRYVEEKRTTFDRFIETCEQLAKLELRNSDESMNFLAKQLSSDADARIFEIVSFAILKEKYAMESIWLGSSRDDVTKKSLKLFKTGRTNANDGGIDFVLKPVGRFFQVTESANVHKYFLDIDKVQKFPITFVIKSNDCVENIRSQILKQARRKYHQDSIVNAYMRCVEQVINTECLLNYFTQIVESGRMDKVMNEIVTHSKVEFNFGANS